MIGPSGPRARDENAQRAGLKPPSRAARFDFLMNVEEVGVQRQPIVNDPLK
jgi:hypothetical protein